MYIYIYIHIYIYIDIDIDIDSVCAVEWRGGGGRGGGGEGGRGGEGGGKGGGRGGEGGRGERGRGFLVLPSHRQPNSIGGGETSPPDLGAHLWVHTEGPPPPTMVTLRGGQWGGD